MSDPSTSDATRKGIDFPAECHLATVRESEDKSIDRDRSLRAGEQPESS
jgi:hypothetical protein